MTLKFILFNPTALRKAKIVLYTCTILAFLSAIGLKNQAFDVAVVIVQNIFIFMGTLSREATLPFSVLVTLPSGVHRGYLTFSV